MIIVGLLLFWANRSDTHSSSDIWMRRFIKWFLFNFTANFMFAVVNRIRLIRPFVGPGSYIFKTLYFITLCIGVYAWIGYAETELGSKFFDAKATRFASFGLLAIPIILIIANFWTKMVFSFDEHGNYIRQAMFQYIMAFLLLGCVVTGVRVFLRSTRESDPIKRSHMRLLGTFPLSIFLAWVFSFADEKYPIVSVIIAVELLVLYIGNSTQQISLDKLTQVNNRQKLISFLEYKFRTHDSRLFALLMDVDYFKSINDKFGHLEGDAALIRVANTLKKACEPFKKRPYIARYGGDEFVIILETSREDVDLLCESIHRILKEMNERDGGEYELKVSIGTSEYIYGMDYNDFIEAADNELYKIKQARVRPANL